MIYMIAAVTLLLPFLSQGRLSGGSRVIYPVIIRVFMVFIFIFHNPAYSHSGGTDANGCHGGSEPYHCHNSGYGYSGGHYDSDGSFYSPDGNIYNPYIEEEPNDSVIIGRWKDAISTEPYNNKEIPEDDSILPFVIVGFLALGVFSLIVRGFGKIEYFLTNNKAVKDADYFTSTGVFLALILLGSLALYFFI